jgi:hypothetical protein
VIIDTGSAHFAIASNVCKGCIISLQDRYQLNEEEDIPMDADNEPMDRSSLHGSAIELLDGVLLNLMGHNPKRSCIPAASQGHQQPPPRPLF